MEKLSFSEMEEVQGGGFMDGVCAVLGLTGGGLGVRAAIGAAVAIPGWGVAVLGLGVAGCAAYNLLK